MRTESSNILHNVAMLHGYNVAMNGVISDELFLTATITFGLCLASVRSSLTRAWKRQEKCLAGVRFPNALALTILAHVDTKTVLPEFDLVTSEDRKTLPEVSW